MPFAMIGFFIGLKEMKKMNLNFWGIKLSLVVLCMVFARSAAMAFNRYLDQDFDAKNPRTAIREIPAGIIKSHQALILTILTGLAFIITTFFINLIFSIILIFGNRMIPLVYHRMI